MQISVIIPAYNEERYIELCLNSLMAQAVEPDEIIVVNNNSRDKTVEEAARYPVRIVDEEKQGLTFARNRGFDEAQYDLLVSCDADTIAPPDWIKKIQREASKKQFDAFTGPLDFYDLPLLRNHLFPSLIYQQAVSRMFGHTVLNGPNLVLTREMWKRVRDTVCLDDKTVHEDIDLSIHIARCGRIGFIPDLAVKTSARRIKYNPRSYFLEYPAKLIKMMEIHTKK